MTKFDCTDIKAMLSAIVDDQLDRDDRHQVERHLAECKPCRRLLDEAEAVDALLAMDADPAPRASLPAGFEEAVLSRTVHANRVLKFRDRRWVTVGGWVASAAAIALAMTIWIADRRAHVTAIPGSSSENAIAIGANPLLGYASNVTNSWIYEGPVEAANPDTSASGGDRSSSANAGATDAAASETPGAPGAIERIMQAGVPTREDAEAMYAAALALDRLRESSGRNFEDLDIVRRTVEYDELMDRLAVAHQRLNAEDRAAVMAAESVFARIVRGPISAEDLDEIKDVIATLELPKRLRVIVKRSDAAISI